LSPSFFCLFDNSEMLRSLNVSSLVQSFCLHRVISSFFRAVAILKFVFRTHWKKRFLFILFSLLLSFSFLSFFLPLFIQKFWNECVVLCSGSSLSLSPKQSEVFGMWRRKPKFFPQCKWSKFLFFFLFRFPQLILVRRVWSLMN
jgi:hypothetical protein